MKTRTILLSLLLAFDLFIAGCLFTEIIEATGGAFPFTKMGATAPGAVVGVGNETEFGGARRKKAVGETAADYVYPIEVYGRGECTQCHEPHASFAGQEPYPNNATGAATPVYFGDISPYGTSDSAIFEGPDPYLLFADNNAVLCWTCHETFTLTQTGDSVSKGGILPQGYSSFGFYQGKPIYEASTHGDPALNANMIWPDAATGADIHPRRSRLAFDGVIAQKGYCLNCHTPHGIMTSVATYDLTAVPAAKQTEAANQSVTKDFLIPRQLIAWEEALCFNCHDGTSATGGFVDDIKSEIEKRSVLGDSGHPVDDTTLAGEHFVGEAFPIQRKHVECYDCHNPHTDKPPSSPISPGDGNAARIEGMRYMDINSPSVEHDPVTGGAGPAGHVTNQPFIMELCFKCHGDSWQCVMPFAADGASQIAQTGACTNVPVGPRLRGVYDSRADCLAHTGTSPCDAATPAAFWPQKGSSNKRLEFNTTTTHTATLQANDAFHPVGAAGRNLSVALCNQLSAGFPTLDCADGDANGLADNAGGLGNLTINCTDCHNNEQTGRAPNAFALLGVLGPVTESSIRATDKASTYGTAEPRPPVGPHGSTNKRLLRGNYDTDLGEVGTWGPGFNLNRFGLCFLCHDSRPFEGLAGSDADGCIGGVAFTNFTDTNCAGATVGEGKGNLHFLHLNSRDETTCHNCHNNVHSNAESINTQYGTNGNVQLPPDGDTHLINFSPQLSALAPNVLPRWRYDAGTGNMECHFKCHDFDMDQFEYYANPS